MNSDALWENYYRETPLEKIPWQKTQANYFTESVDNGKIEPGLALDLGCGTGMKSIYLAQKGFEVTAIDISKTAISFAKENATKAKVNVNFIVADATDLSLLKKQKFDFVLDWANFHGIPKNKRKKHIEAIARHTKKGGKLLLRCFGREQDEKESVLREMGRIYLFSEEEIRKLFGKHFKILEVNKSKPFVRKEKKPPARWLNEYLMEKL